VGEVGVEPAEGHPAAEVAASLDRGRAPIQVPMRVERKRRSAFPHSAHCTTAAQVKPGKVTMESGGVNGSWA
jgi:hypothetical protein